MLLSAAFFVATLTATRPPAPVLQADSACLHAAGRETPDQRNRSVAALGATRAVNTAESTFASKNGGRYAPSGELSAYLDAARYNLTPGADIVPGFRLTLDTTPKGYWFEIVDTTDVCGFRFISNQNGLIFTAQPIR